MAGQFDRDRDEWADSAWALYHENSKRGRRLEGIGAPIPAMDIAAVTSTDDEPSAGALVLPAVRPLIRVSAESGASAQGPGEPMPLGTLSAVLATACRPMANPDPVHFFIHASSVKGLDEGFYRPDRHGRWLHRLDGDPGQGLAAVLPDQPPDGTVQAIIFFIGDLDLAARTGGERGYRHALVAVGRHALALDLAAAASGLVCREVARFFDRELDRLLGLDGLAGSVLHVAALGLPADVDS